MSLDLEEKIENNFEEKEIEKKEKSLLKSNKDNQRQIKNKKSKIIQNLFLELIIAILIFASLGIRWAFNNFDNCSIESMLFQLSEPLEGTNDEVVKEGIVNIIGYGFVVLVSVNVIYFVFTWILRKIIKNKTRIIKIIKVVLILSFIITNIVYIFIKSDFKTFWKNQTDTSNLYEENYVDPNSVSIKFPEEKRNLIFIILESMEVSYADTSNGGVMETNLIPELTNLMEENINFSHNSDTIGGAHNFSGTNWTVAALVSEMTGIPLKLSINGNDYGKFKNFLPGATTLGDILEKQGYNQMFICGSPISFGGRDKFFNQHGNYEILDYDTAVSTGRYTGEKQNWGFIDSYLYEYTKEELLRLSKEDEPFNVTLLTADTHHPNGYLCEDCGTEHNKKYKNVISCASKKVVEFVEWIKEQDFYENTTIVILGDHPTMSTDFADVFSDEYKRTTINCFINSAITECNKYNRSISSMDMFPTILASIGAEIEGDRLGIGTNLFSDKQTLAEELTPDGLNHFLVKKSDFYNSNILKTKDK